MSTAVNSGDVSEQRRFIFFIGTTAELIKVLPVMLEMDKRGLAYDIIASGQNDIKRSELFDIADLPPVKLQINKPLRRKSALGLLIWFLVTFLRGAWLLPAELRGNRTKTTLIVHGDTISTVMGAVLGKIFRLKVAHIEAGLRSGNFLQPFPEEIDRYLTSFFADYHFCPYSSAVRNLDRRRGEKIDTKYNTNIDALEFARMQSNIKKQNSVAVRRPYFIFILHRQENLFNKALIKDLLEILLDLVEQFECIFVTHELTEIKLREIGVYDKIATHPKIHMTGRKPYVEFIAILDNSEFIMTDGGGNQQECYYLGKPCLLLRDLTESEEGVGTNLCVSKNDKATIADFVINYRLFRHPEIRPSTRPSEIIVDALTQARNRS